MLVDTDTNDKPRQGDAVRDLLEQRARAAERRRRQPHAAPAVDHKRERQIHGQHQPTRDQRRAAVVLRPSHLGDDGQVHGRPAVADEDVRAGGDARDEGGVRDGGPAELEGAGLRGDGGAVLLCDGDDEDEDGDEEGGEAEPGQPAKLAEGADGGEGGDEDGAEEGEDDGAGAVGRDGVEGGGDGDDACGGDEDLRDQDLEADQLAAGAGPEAAAHVGEGWKERC